MKHFLHRYSQNHFLLLFSFFSLFMLLLTYVIVASVSVKNLFGLDIQAFYSAGFMIRQGVREAFYSFPVQYHWQKILFALPSPKHLIPFYNPPFVAAAFAPLAFLSPKHAYTMLSFIDIAILLISFYFMLKERFKENTVGLVPILIFLFFYIPTIASIYLGQISFVLLCSLVMSWYFFKHEKPISAGIFLSLLTVKPHLLFVPIIVLLWKKQWRALFGLLVSASIMLFISWILIGTNGLKTYIQLLFTIPSRGNAFAVHPQIEPTLRGFLQLSSHTNVLSSILVPFIVVYIMLIALLLYTWKDPWNAKIETFDIQWAITILILVLTSIHTNYSDLILLSFSYVIFLTTLKKKLLRYLAAFLIDIILLIFFPSPALIVPLNCIILGMLIYERRVV